MSISTLIDDLMERVDDEIADNALTLISDDAGVMIRWDATWAFVDHLAILLDLKTSASDAAEHLRNLAAANAGDIAIEIRSLQEHIYSLDTAPAETIDWQGICERLRAHFFTDA